MSQIDKLIADLCPDGVEFKRIADVSSKGSKIKWAQVGNAEYQYIDLGAVEPRTRQIGKTQTINSCNAPSRAQQIVHSGDIIFATTRPTQLRWAVIPDSYDGQVVSTGYCVIRPDRSSIITNYLAHTLGTTSFLKYLKANQILGNYPSIPDSRIQEFRVPVPPLEVQREIVRVLDKFTQLEAELEAELEARRRQYEHYKIRLLTFDPKADWCTLGEIADYVNGKAQERFTSPQGDIPLVTARFVSRNGEANRFIHHDDILTPALAGDTALVLSDLPNGRALARTFFVDKDNRYAINQRVARIRTKDQSRVNPRFIYRYLDRNPSLLMHDNGVDQTHLSKAQVTQLRFPLPPLEEQRRIVSILDKFDSLVNDLSVGLPAELAARRKQYEYYRDRLLTFEEKR